MKELKGLDVLISRMDVIARECGVYDTGSGEGEGSNSKDEFVRIKVSIYSHLGDVRNLIRERKTKHIARGICREVIEHGVRITGLLRSLDANINRLAVVYKSQMNKKKKYTEDELTCRLQDVNILRRLIQETHNAYRGNALHDDELRTVTELTKRSDLFSMVTTAAETPASQHTQSAHTCAPSSAAQTPSASAGGRNEGGVDAEAVRRVVEEMNNTCSFPSAASYTVKVSDEDTQTMSRWTERDRAMDKDLEDISEALEGLENFAIRIGETTDRHDIMAQEIRVDTDEARIKVKAMTQRVKKLISNDHNSTFVIRILLAIILLLIGGYVYVEYNQIDTDWLYNTDNNNDTNTNTITNE
eukprot:GHVQ01041987.1.p1 GENE.GHVQ01041987.1~~GHVQ01041987.1.p1  ORF type:complete len:358 (+),score=63.17 GHVQ01041987.1:190-1263(+)